MRTLSREAEALHATRLVHSVAAMFRSRISSGGQLHRSRRISHIMKTRSLLLTALFLGCALSGSQQLSASVIFNNLSEAAGPDSDYRLICRYGSDAWSEVAQSFTTDGRDYMLTLVTPYIKNNLPTDGSLVAEIYSAGSGVPGGYIATLTALDAISNDFSPVRFSGAGVHLAAGTTYWILLRATSGNFSWGAATGAGAGLVRTDYADWFPGFIDELGDQIVKVEGDAMSSVPEPSTVLCCVPLLALGLCLRRRAQR
jgi:hypothetical protein